MALKHIAWKLWCVWNGHEIVVGDAYSVVYGARRPCLCCRQCHAFIRWV